MMQNSSVPNKTKTNHVLTTVKIRTKDDTHKLPLKSNQSIILLHNSTVTVNKKGQKEQNCARNCALLNTDDVERG